MIAPFKISSAWPRTGGPYRESLLQIASDWIMGLIDDEECLQEAQSRRRGAVKKYDRFGKGNPESAAILTAMISDQDVLISAVTNAIERQQGAAGEFSRRELLDAAVRGSVNKDGSNRGK